MFFAFGPDKSMASCKHPLAGRVPLLLFFLSIRSALQSKTSDGRSYISEGCAHLGNHANSAACLLSRRVYRGWTALLSDSDWLKLNLPKGNPMLAAKLAAKLAERRFHHYPTSSEVPNEVSVAPRIRLSVAAGFSGAALS